MSGFDDLYFQLRSKENRIYQDAEVLQLPKTHETHIYKHEWEIRESSCRRFTKYLKQKNKPLKILEIGCGNGWLSSEIAKMPALEVTGIDTNFTEVEQAKRVFRDRSNLHFKLKTIEEEITAGHVYDIVLFAASIQYFFSLQNIVEKAFILLTQYGEMHILDTHFYKPSEINAAKKRSGEYFSKMGFAQMENHYFHHSITDLKKFNYKILYNPGQFMRKFSRRKNPFYWIRITK